MQNINTINDMRYFLIIFFTCVFFSASAQINLRYNLNTPKSAVETHLKFLQADSYFPHISAKAFPYSQEYNPIDLQIRALQLKRIFDGQSIVIDWEEISDNPNHVDSTRNNKAVYVIDKQHPEIYLERINGRWQYSRETTNKIPDLYRQTYPFGSHRLLDMTETWRHEQYLGLYIWQYVGILLTFLLGGLIFLVFKFIMRKIARFLIRWMGFPDLADEYAIPIARPLSWFLTILFWIYAFRLLQLPVEKSYYLMILLKAFWPIFGTVVLYRLIGVFSHYFLNLASKGKTLVSEPLIPLIQKTLQAVVITMGFLFILQNVGFQITSLLAGISIGGLAIALAAQDTIKNVFGSLMIYIDKPFNIGDEIKGTDLHGTVEEIGLRSTRIRTLYNSVISIPNGKMADLTVDNLGARVFRRMKIEITIAADTTPDEIDIFIIGMRRIAYAHPTCKQDEVDIYLNSLENTSIGILFQMFFEVPNWSLELKARHEVLSEILKLAQALRIRFAFPTSTVHIETLPGQLPLTPSHSLKREQLEAKMNEHLLRREKEGIFVQNQA
jgi:MscS family membrane protein